MEKFSELQDVLGWLVPLIIILSVWDGIWKLIALWKAARNNELAWFICIALLNTVGILPIVYILMNKRKEQTQG